MALEFQRSNVVALLERGRVNEPAPYKLGNRCCQQYLPIYLKQEKISVIELSSSGVGRYMFLPFNIEDPHRESFPGDLQGREYVLEEGDPDQLQDGT